MTIDLHLAGAHGAKVLGFWLLYTETQGFETDDYLILTFVRKKYLEHEPMEIKLLVTLSNNYCSLRIAYNCLKS